MDTEHEPLSDEQDVSVEMDEPVIDAPTPPRFPVEKVVFGVFAGVAVLMLVVAAATGYATTHTLAREQTAAGRVVELTPRTVSVPVETDDPARKRYVDREYFYPVVEFDLPDGTHKRVQTAEGSWPPAYEVGQGVAVRYDPDHPTSARIESGSGAVLMWVWTIVTGVLGLAFGAATVLIHRVFLRRP
jgi:hypothetical protein